jgi:hypothetical protein
MSLSRSNRLELCRIELAYLLTDGRLVLSISLSTYTTRPSLRKDGLNGNKEESLYSIKCGGRGFDSHSGRSVNERSRLTVGEK